MSFEEYCKEVVQQAQILGYHKQVIDCFLFDIKQHYEDGLSVDECIEIEF